jgi:hypothetical protein
MGPIRVDRHSCAASRLVATRRNTASGYHSRLRSGLPFLLTLLCLSISAFAQAPDARQQVEAIYAKLRSLDEWRLQRWQQLGVLAQAQALARTRRWAEEKAPTTVEEATTYLAHVKRQQGSCCHWDFWVIDRADTALSQQERGEYGQRSASLIAELAGLGQLAVPLLIAEIDVPPPYTTPEDFAALPRFRERGWAMAALSTEPMRSEARPQLMALLEKRLPDTPNWRGLFGPDALPATAAAHIIAGGATTADKPLLARWLGDRNPILRRSAVDGLRRLKDPDAIFLLIQALNDTDISICAKAAVALGESAGPEAVPQLEMMAERLQFEPGGKDAADRARVAIRRIESRQAARERGGE